VHIRFKNQYLPGIVGLAVMLIVACGGNAPSAAPAVTATSVPPTTVVVAVTAVPPTPTTLPPATATNVPEPTEQVVKETELRNDADKPKVVVFRVTDRSIEAPEFIPAGLTTIRLQNDGSLTHELTLIHADDGRTADELETKTKLQNWPGPWSPSIASIRAEPGESNEFTAVLIPGIFAAVDWSSGSDSIPHSAFGVYTGFEVIEADFGDIAWNPDTIEVGLEDFSFTGIQDLSSGRHSFKLVNKSDNQPHELLFVPLDEGQSAAELFTNFRSVKFGGTPVKNLERAFGIGWIGPGEEIEHSLDLFPGNYAVVCLIPNAFPGTPHVNLGMLQQITVSE